MNLLHNKIYQKGYNYLAFEELSKIPFPNLKFISMMESGFDDKAAAIL